MNSKREVHSIQITLIRDALDKEDGGIHPEEFHRRVGRLRLANLAKLYLTGA